MLSIQNVKDSGNLTKERLVLKAISSTNTGTYLVADTTYIDENEVSDKLRHIFWLPNKEVDQGDLIVIYTRDGGDKTIKNKSGNKTHFFYWGLERTVWNKDEDAVTLFSIEDWVMKQV